MFDPQIIHRHPVKASAEDLLARFNKDVHYNLDYEYSIWQAQLRLQNRSQQELEAGAVHLRELLFHAEEIEHDRLVEKMEAGEELIFQSDPSKFTALFQEFDLDQQADFPNATPSEYFAILALVYTLESLEVQLEADSRQARVGTLDPLDELQLPSLTNAAKTRLRDAHAMISFIEGIEFEAIFRKKNASRANRAKNQGYRRLKSEIFQFVDKECQELSNRKAAQVAYLQFRKIVDQVSSSDDPEHQIAKWIGEHRKESRTSK